MLYSTPPTASPIARRQNGADSPFSFDNEIRKCSPDGRVQLIEVEGRMGYCPVLGIQHGDILCVVPDTCDHPESLLLVDRGNGSYLIRKRSQAAAILATGRSFAKRGNIAYLLRSRVVGRVVAMFRSPKNFF